MAAFDFPASPSVGQKYPASPVAGVPTYTWDGEKWTTIGGAVSGGLAVCYDIVQTLTAPQQLQARQNIDVPAAATAAEYLANSAPTKMLTPGAAWGAAILVNLGSVASITPDFGAGLDFQWLPSSATGTINNPTNTKQGQKGVIYILQNGGFNITTWGSAYKFAGGVKPVMTAAAGACDILSYVVYSSTQIYCTYIADAK